MPFVMNGGSPELVLVFTDLGSLKELLLYVDHFAGRVQGSVHPHFLAIKLFHFILMVNVVGCAGGCVLQNILVALLHNCPAKRLAAGLILRGLRLSVTRCLSGGRLAWSSLIRSGWCSLVRSLRRGLRVGWRL